MAISKADDIASTARITTEEIRQAASLQTYIYSKQQRILGALQEAITHPVATLFQSYVKEDIPATTGLPWLRTTLDEAIWNGPHASACAPDMVSFIQGELRQRVQDGFSILLSAEDAARLFREKLNLSHIAAIPQDQLRPRLILNLSAPPNKETPSVNNTTDR